MHPEPSSCVPVDGAATVMPDVDSYELSADGRKLMVRRTDAIFVFVPLVLIMKKSRPAKGPVSVH